MAYTRRARPHIQLERELGCGDCGHDHTVMPSGWATGHDLDHSSAEADDRANLPCGVIGAGKVEDQPTAPCSKRRAKLVHDEGQPKQGCDVSGAKNLGDQTTNERRQACSPIAAVLVGVGGNTK